MPVHMFISRLQKSRTRIMHKNGLATRRLTSNDNFLSIKGADGLRRRIETVGMGEESRYDSQVKRPPYLPSFLPHNRLRRALFLCIPFVRPLVSSEFIKWGGIYGYRLYRHNTTVRCPGFECYMQSINMHVRHLFWGPTRCLMPHGARSVCPWVSFVYSP